MTVEQNEEVGWKENLKRSAAILLVILLALPYLPLLVGYPGSGVFSQCNPGIT